MGDVASNRAISPRIIVLRRICAVSACFLLCLAYRKYRSLIHYFATNAPIKRIIRHDFATIGELYLFLDTLNMTYTLGPELT
jgi:hypothetical protein